MRALNEAADRCEFPDRSVQIRDRIVVGAGDQNVSREMQKMEVDHLTDAKVPSMVQAEEVDHLTDAKVPSMVQAEEVDHLTDAKVPSMVQAEEVGRQMRELNLHTQVDAVRTRSRHVRATSQSLTQSAKGCT